MGGGTNINIAYLMMDTFMSSNTAITKSDDGHFHALAHGDNEVFTIYIKDRISDGHFHALADGDN